MKRREFIQGAAALGLTAIGMPAVAQQQGRAPAARRPVRLGAPAFHSQEDPVEFVRKHKLDGYRAAYCPRVSLTEPDRVRAFRAAFEQNDIVIAEVGRWCNLLDPDDKKRAANMARMIDGLALADEIGARCCVNIAGSFNPTVWFGPHPENLSDRFFDAVVENAQKIIDEVKPKRAKLAYEMMAWALPDSVDSYLRMIKAVDRPAFGVHLDPCNLVNCPARYYDTGALINDCFDRLGPYIASCHAKDITWDISQAVHFRECEIGQGTLDYRTYLRRLATMDRDVPLMIEHMKGKEAYDRCRTSLHKVGREARVVFDWMN